MANLAAYIDFTAVLSKAVSPPVLKIADPDNYPVGVDLTLKGYVTVTQPDGITVTYGSFVSPVIFWNGSQLVQPSFELRLSNTNSFQNGGYTITYNIRATGYDDTTLTKTFTLSYSRPLQSIGNNFDIFTPNLSVTDTTIYTQPGMALDSVVWDWGADIVTVSGTTQSITGNAVDFDLAYGGDYYDSRYDITLTSFPQYLLDTPNGWVTLIDNLVKTTTFYAQIPQEIEDLDAGLQTLKNQADAAACNCQTGDDLRERYIYGTTLYSDFRRKGCDNEIAGLTTTYFQLIKLYNNNVNPTYENTNEIIPGYDFQCGGGGAVNWDNIVGKPSTILVEGLVGGSGMPSAGASTFGDSGLTGVTDNRILFIRNGLQQFASDQGDGDTYFAKVQADAFITIFPTPFILNEKLILIILPL